MLLASFNYDQPSTLAIAVGILIGLLILILAGVSRRVLFGIFATAVGWALIAAVVCYQGRGDLTIIMIMFFGAIFGLAGAIVGGLTAYCVKRAANRGTP